MMLFLDRTILNICLVHGKLELILLDKDNTYQEFRLHVYHHAFFQDVEES